MKHVIIKLSLIGLTSIAFNLAVTDTSFGQSPLLRKVVGMWLFDDGGRPRVIKDISGNGHHADIRNGPKLVKGKFGRAMRFNGAFHAKTYLEVPDHEELQITDVMSIVAWVKRPIEAEDRAPYYILAKGREWQFDAPCYGFALHKVFDNMLFFWYKGGYQGTDGVIDGQWHHYAVVARNGSTTPTLYIDGEPKTVTHVDGKTRINLARSPENSTINNLIIGALVPGKPRFHSFSENTIDEVAIFRSELTHADIKHVMKKGLNRSLYAVQAADKLATSWAKLRVGAK